MLGARAGRLEWRHFPDGESLVTIEEDLHGVDVALVASLCKPDELALPLRFAAATARDPLVLLRHIWPTCARISGSILVKL